MGLDVIPEQVKRPASDRPWTIPAVINWLEGVLLPHWTVLETGAGGSTVFFAQQVKRVISYEHDPEWAAQVARWMVARGLDSRVDLRLRPTYAAAGLDCMEPYHLAFIDGRGRVRSVIDALPALCPGGWLVLDDAGRDRYAEARRVMDNACSERIEFRAPPWQPEQWTTAWRKR